VTKDELIEALADIEHQRWSSWQRYVHEDVCEEEGVLDSGNLVIPPDKVAHWNRLIATPYAELPEHSKQSDRDEVMKYWPLIVEFVAEWIRETGPELWVYMADLWLDDMRPEQV